MKKGGGIRISICCLALCLLMEFVAYNMTNLELQSSPLWKDKKAIRAQKLISIGSDDLNKPESFFGFISDVYVDDANNVYVLDSKSYKASKFSGNGKFLGTFGKGPGQGPGEFQFVSDVSADASGHVYISDNDTRKIVVFDTSNTVISTFSTIKAGPIYDMTVDIDSKLYVGVDARSIAAGIWKGGIYQIFRIPDGEFIGSIGKAWNKDATERHVGSNSICIDKKNGRVILSYSWPYLIEVYSRNGHLLKQFGRKAPFFDVLAKDGLGNLMVCGSSMQVACLPDGKIINLIRQRFGRSDDRSDYINHLDLFDENGVYLLTSSWDILEPDDRHDIRGLAADNQGNIWIVIEDPYPHIVKYGIEIVDIKK